MGQGSSATHIQCEPSLRSRELWHIEGLLCDHDEELKHLECDGFTRVAHYVLHTNGVSHRCYKGTCTVGDKTIDPHFWIVAGNLIVDYRLRMWAGDDAPHGVFESKKFPNVKYEGEEIELNVSAVLFEILTEIKVA